MKVSLRELKKYVDIDISVDELVDKIGAQLGAVEEVIDIGKKYQGILVAKVIECHKLEGSDHLNVCKVDDGGKAQNVGRDEAGHVQVVCGAPNCHEGLLVAWLPPGAIVPSTVDKDPLVLEAREIRGVKSNGMLASPKELDISDNHEGILEINLDNWLPNKDKIVPGADFAEVFGLNDTIIDIENKMFTHRPDCFGVVGIAREIAGIEGKPFHSPDWLGGGIRTAKEPEANDNLKLEVINELPALVPRFSAQIISDIEVSDSGIAIQIFLSKFGLKSVNNIVDITNYIMILTGQPLHAYDYDKVKTVSGTDGAKIVIRYPKPGEKIKLLNGKEIEPRSEGIMIATDKQLIGIGGVMGGSETEVDKTTKNIILECASFDMYSIRRTSMEHGLFTDAVVRFNKGQSPLQCEGIMKLTINSIISEEPGTEVVGETIDINQLKDRNWVHPPVKVSADFINVRLGLKLSPDEMKQLLENVEFRVDINNDELTVTAPLWRTDIELREDVVEEIGRLYGYDKLPLELPVRSVKPTKKDKNLELKSKIRSELARAGANEVLTYSFIDSELMKKVGQNPNAAFQISNAISPGLQYYRLSLTPSLLEKINPNVKAGYSQFTIFELGKAHNLEYKDTDEGLPSEFDHLALVVSKSGKNAGKTAAFYDAKKYLTYLIELFGQKLSYKPIPKDMDSPILKPFDPQRSTLVIVKGTDVRLGVVGEYRNSVRKSLKLSNHTAGFEFGLAQLREAIDKDQSSHYTPLSRFPKVMQDITLKVPSELKFQDVSDFIYDKLSELKPKATVFSLEPVGIFQKPDDKAYKNLTFHISITSYERTLTDNEVSNLLNKMADAAQEKFGSERL